MFLKLEGEDLFMNKIYKIVWSKVKNCYVVASEMAKSHSKSSVGRVLSKSLVAGVLACVLSSGFINSTVFAASSIQHVGVTGTATTDGFLSFVVRDNLNLYINGMEVSSANGDDDWVGYYIKAGDTWVIDFPDGNLNGCSPDDLWYGYGFFNPMEHSVYTAGNGVTVSGTTISARGGTNVTVNGNGINVNGTGSVASGNGGLVSGGTAYSELRPANGSYVSTNNTTAANLSALDRQTKANTDAIGVVNADGSYIKRSSTNNVSQNLVVLDTQAKNEATTRQTADNALSKRIGVVDGDGHYIKSDYNVAGNLKTLDNALYNLNNLSADKDMSNITNNGKTVIRNLAKESVKVVDGENTTVAKGTDGDAVTYAVSVSTDGRVADGDTGIVTGGTVYKAIQNSTSGLEPMLDGKADVDASNVRGHESEWSSVLGKGTVASGNNQMVTGNTMYLELRPSTGDYIKASNTTAQNLTALDRQIKNVSDELVDINDTKADTDLGNITNEGKEVIRELAKGSVKVVKGNHTTVTEGTTLDDVKTYAVNVETNGIVKRGDTNVVSGGTVYNAIEDAKNELGGDIDEKLKGYAKTDGSNVVSPETWGNKIGTGKVLANNKELVTGGTVYKAVTDAVNDTNAALDMKANVDASNVGKNASSDNSEAWGEAIGTGTVSKDDGRLVTGETLYEELRPSVDGQYVKETNTTSQNLQALDSEISSLSKASENFVKYDEENHDKVTLGGTDGTVITNLRDGELSETSTDAVTGKQLYATNQEVDRLKESLSDTGDAVRELRTEYYVTKEQVMAGFDVKADDSLVKNVNPNSNFINFVSGDHVSIKNAEGSVRVDVVADGQVASGNTGLVTGDAVAKETRVESDGSYVTKDNTVAQNITTLDTVLKETRDLAEATAASAHDLSAVHYDADTKDTVTLQGENGTLITNLKDGTLSADSKDAVTGKQLFETNEILKDTKDSLDSLKDTVGTVEDGAYVSSDKTFGENIGLLDTQLKTVSDGLDAMRTDVTNLQQNFEDGMNGKANTDMSNLTEDGETVIRELAKGAVKVTGSGAATVTSTDDGTTTVYNVDVQGNGVVEEGNTGLVNGGTVYTSITNLRNELSDGLDGKINTDMSNLTDDGKDVIREVLKDDLALKADKVDLDTKANVDASNIEIEAWKAILGDGVVVEGNTGLVNGDTAYRAIQNVVHNQVAKADFDNGVIRLGHDAQFDALDKVDISKSDGSSRVLTGIVTDASDKSSAANVGYVNAVGNMLMDSLSGSMERMHTKVNRVGANAAAMSALTPASFEGDEKWSLAASVGNYRSQTAGAVGAFYKPLENVMMNVRGSFGTDENMVAAGVAVALNKGDVPGVTKRQLVQTVNAQANKIMAMDQNYQSQIAQMNQNHQAEIAQLKDQVARMAQKIDELEKTR